MYTSRPRTPGPGGVVTQLYYARQGVITDEMAHVADIEKLSPELISEEVAAGRLVITANIHHPELQPAAIGSVVT